MGPVHQGEEEVVLRRRARRQGNVKPGEDLLGVAVRLGQDGVVDVLPQVQDVFLEPRAVGEGDPLLRLRVGGQGPGGLEPAGVLRLPLAQADGHGVPAPVFLRGIEPHGDGVEVGPPAAADVGGHLDGGPLPLAGGGQDLFRLGGLAGAAGGQADRQERPGDPEQMLCFSHSLFLLPFCRAKNSSSEFLATWLFSKKART